MLVLVIGGNQWLQQSIVSALGEKQYRVRLFAESDSRATPAWPAHVEPWPGSGDDPGQVNAAIRGCDVVLVLGELSDTAGLEVVLRGSAIGCVVVVTLTPAAPDQFNDTERIARDFTGGWLVMRAPLVYGINDDAVTRLLVMMRSLPVVSLPEGGSLSPVWHRDLAAAIANAIASPEVTAGHTLHLLGPESTTYDDLFDRLSLLIDKRPWRLPLPERLAVWASSLPAESGSDAGAGQDAWELLGVTPTPLGTGLQLLVNELGEQTPFDVGGNLELKRFSTIVVNGRWDARGLMEAFRSSFKDVMPVPIGVEPVAPATQLREGETLSMHLPGRGHVQVRVEEASATETVLATLRGHFAAGVVRFTATDRPGGVRFEVMTCDTPAHWLDTIALRAGGARIQDANWLRVLTNVARLAGGETSQTSVSERFADDDEQKRLEQWIASVIRQQEGVSDPAPRLAVVTGASSGIGLELARCCARTGFEPLIAADEPQLTAVADDLRSQTAVEALVVDLATADGVERLYAALGGRVPALLIANAGIALGGSVLDQGFSDVQRVIDTNITGTLDLVQRIGRDMREKRSGRILITSSIAAYIPGTFDSVYNASKAFLTSFAHALRAELAGNGVLVTCLMPGPTHTAIFERSGMGDTRVGTSKAKDDPRDVAEAAFAAVMHGQAAVVPGWRTYIQYLLAGVTPSPVLAEMHRRSAEPGAKP